MSGTPRFTHPFYATESQFMDDLNSWIRSNSDVLPQAMLMKDLFFEETMPALTDVFASQPSAGPSGAHFGSFPGNNNTPNNNRRSASPVTGPFPSTDEHKTALQFAARHRAWFGEILHKTGLPNWTLLCDVMLVRFFSDSGTQVSRPFCGWREESYNEFITNTYDSLLRQGVKDFELREISIEVKAKNGTVKVVKAQTTLANSNFTEALHRMLSEDFPRVLTAHWGGVASALIHIVLPVGTPNRVEIALSWTRRTDIDGVYSYPFLHDSSGTLINYYARPQLLNALHLALTHPELDTFAAIFSTTTSPDGVLTFGLLRHANTHTFSVVAALILTALDFIGQKKGGLVGLPWTVGDTKEKKFREVQKAMVAETRASLSCISDIVKMPMPMQVGRRKSLLYAFDADDMGGIT